jgi:hypothetical protein
MSVPLHHGAKLLMYNFSFNLVIFYRQATKPGWNNLRRMYGSVWNSVMHKVWNGIMHKV